MPDNATTPKHNAWNWLSKSILSQAFVFDSSLNLYVTLLVIRLLNSLTLKTYFQADEYWQALEPAHKLVYGYGFLTWEWRQGLRSFIHPLIYSMIYKTCEELSLSYSYILYLPKVVNALIASVGDFYLFKLSKKVTQNEAIARLTLVLGLLSSFNWYCSTRSFSNTLEMHLTTIALYYFPSNMMRSLMIAAFCCIIRPTNAIIWIYLCSRYLLKSHKIIKTCITAIASGIIAILADTLLNRWYYGQFVIPLVQFFQFNVSRSLSSFYGVSRPDFYFFQAIPILLLNFLPFFLYGCYKPMESLKPLRSTSLFYLVAFSFIHHKEFRFIYPLMPIFLMLTAVGLSRILARVRINTGKIIAIATILISGFLSFYFSIYHESGVIKITQILRQKILAEDTNQVSDVGFLTPCHSTPYQSYFHLDPSKADIWWLTCEPPLQLTSAAGLSSYRDESDQFYDDPTGFLRSNFPSPEDISNQPPKDGKYPHKWPEYLVFFQYSEPFFKKYLANSSYVEDTRLFNSRFHWDYRRTGDLIIYKRKPSR